MSIVTTCIGQDNVELDVFFNNYNCFLIPAPLPVVSIAATYRGQDNIELEWVPPDGNTGFDGFEIVVVRASDGNQVSVAIFISQC